MKISRTFLSLIFAALILFAGTFYSAKIGQQITDNEEAECLEKIKRQVETQDCFKFAFSERDIDKNFADYIAIGLFILAMSTTLAAIWTKKIDR